MNDKCSAGKVLSKEHQAYWFIKRMVPNTFYNFHGLIFKQGILDRLLGADLNKNKGHIC